MSSLGFSGSSNYVHPFGLAVVLPVLSAPFGSFLFPLPLVSLSVFGRVRAAVDERVKVKVRVYQNTLSTDPTACSDPVSCLLSGREGASWTPVETTHCVFVIDVQGKNGQGKTVVLVKFPHNNSESDAENTGTTSFYFKKQFVFCLSSSVCTETHLTPQPSAE